MIGVIVNAAGVLIGGSIGLLLKKGIPEKWSELIFKGIALCVIYIGVAGSLEGKNTVVLILSMALGALAGQAPDLDGKINCLGDWIERKFKRGGYHFVAEGFGTSSLLFVSEP